MSRRNGVNRVRLPGLREVARVMCGATSVHRVETSTDAGDSCAVDHAALVKERAADDGTVLKQGQQ